ncbi:C40 family peptidase [Pseudomonas sp. SCB32]|uniref:C40 family peptidase n=1 Tax=Pseudomonas sp. SCB32 TaxID=2653853 RepID=UPI00126598D9|nr:C40 family peptidase [Pseudomonas sp. SCB32]
MRPSPWLPLFLLCATCSPGLALADDFDVPSWRRYQFDALEQQLARPAVRPSPPRPATTLTPTEGRRSMDTTRIIARAYELIGKPYRWGGESLEEGFDCSGLLVYLYSSIANRKLPRTTASMIAQHDNEVGADELRPGDAVFFNHNGNGQTSHVGLYIGDKRFIHAPSTGKTIRIDSLADSYWQRSYTTARRFSG